MKTNAKFLNISPGATVRVGPTVYRIEIQTSEQTVLARRETDGGYDTLRIATLSSADKANDAIPGTHDLVADSADYDIARARLDVIRPLLGAGSRPRSQVEEVARSAGKSIRTIYNWLAAYTDAPLLSSLIPVPRGPTPGQKTLDPKLDAIIAHAIETHLKTPQRKRVSRVIDAVDAACFMANIKPPHANTVRRRVKSIPRAEILQAQGRSDEADLYRPMIGGLPGAVAPLSIVEIDHYQGDVVLVDETLRLPLGRPWITAAIDVHTRMIVGLVVSMEAPGAFAAGRCIAHVMTPKDETLRRLGVSGEWPSYGRPHVVHMDNAKEFRGGVLKDACAEYGIDIQFRPGRTPRYGGHVERLFRTLGEAIRDLPGATFSNPKERSGYDSDTKSAMTLSEFESWLIDYFVNRYHQESHSQLDQAPPIEAWRQGIQRVGLFSPPVDPQRLALDFLPFERRTIGRRGIVIDHIHYFENELRHWIARGNSTRSGQPAKFLVRIDPRDISRIWVLDPERKEYIRVSTLDRTRPAISRWEWRAVQQHVRASGQKTIDESLLFTTYERLRKRAEDAEAKTKAARKAQQRALDTKRHASVNNGSSGVATPVHMIAVTPANKPKGLFDEPIEPFDDIDG